MKEQPKVVIGKEVPFDPKKGNKPICTTPADPITVRKTEVKKTSTIYDIRARNPKLAGLIDTYVPQIAAQRKSHSISELSAYDVLVKIRSMASNTIQKDLSMEIEKELGIESKN